MAYFLESIESVIDLKFMSVLLKNADKKNNVYKRIAVKILHNIIIKFYF